MEQWEQIIESIELPTQDQNVYIWGAGNTSVLNHQGMLRENLYEEFRVTAFLDSKLAGTEFNGFPVCHPDKLYEVHPSKLFVLISTTNGYVFREIAEWCKKKGIQSCPIDAAILKVRKKEFLRASALLDGISKDIYHKLLKYRITFSDSYDTLYAGESYFGLPFFCKPSIRDVIIDCGAYVGDSAERFLWRMDKFQKYVALEPDPDNYHAMQRRFSRLCEEWNLPDGKLLAINAGVDAETKTMMVESHVGGLSSVAKETSEDGNKIKFWKLDELIPNGYTFLKADIESYEYRMLLGATETITQFHPRIAICIYHNMVDMYSIPLLIHEMKLNYRLAVRHHSYGYEETVLYAY